MTDDAQISPDAKPRLPRGVRLTHSEAQGGWVLLAPERVFKADAIAVEIIKRCTGEATFGEIVDDLAAIVQRAARAHRGRCDGVAARARRQAAAGTVSEADRQRPCTEIRRLYIAGASKHVRGRHAHGPAAVSG